MDAAQTQVVAPAYSFYGYYVCPVFSWLRLLTSRFIKGIFDGIIYTPIFMLIFGGLRKMKKAKN
jgi:hypothetical protein